MSFYYYYTINNSNKVPKISHFDAYVKLGGGQGGTDPPPGDWCLGLVPPPTETHRNLEKL